MDHHPFPMPLRADREEYPKPPGNPRAQPALRQHRDGRTSRWVPRETGELARMSMAEVFEIRDGKIAERHAWVIPLSENEHR